MNEHLERATKLHARAPQILAQRNQAIRDAVADGVSRTEVANELGLTVTAITNIVKAG